MNVKPVFIRITTDAAQRESVLRAWELSQDPVSNTKAKLARAGFSGVAYIDTKTGDLVLYDATGMPYSSTRGIIAALGVSPTVAVIPASMEAAPSGAAFADAGVGVAALVGVAAVASLVILTWGRK